MASRNEFLTDMCYTLVATNIPFNKLQSTPFKNFLQKYVNQNIPDESRLRKNYLKICFESTLKKIREKLTNNFIYIMVYETTDSRGLYICSLIVGILHPEIMPTSFLISCKELKKTNYETVSRFVNDSLMEFFGDTLFQEKILLFISDAAPYMIKTGGALKIFYSNMIHITCLAHDLNRVVEKVRHFPGKFKELVSNIEDDAQSVQKVKSILNTTPIISDLTFIRSHLSELPNSITKLEKQNSTLNYQINVVETVRDGLKTIENEKGQILYEKFKSVFDKNPGYNILKLYNNSINGKDVDLKEEPAIISCYKQCPITSVDVEQFETNVICTAPEPFLYENVYVTSHKGACRADAFSPDGQLIGTGSSDASIKA
ncbi:hypothetical protein QTP88_006732 [Uroleucon formosanum]